jgi:hypothetical protein
MQGAEGLALQLEHAFAQQGHLRLARGLRGSSGQ